MGYDIHITRKEDWFDEDKTNNISMDEWQSFVASQPDMRMDNYAEAELPDGILRYENTGIAVWTGYSGNDKNTAWFNYSNGYITVKNPDDEILLKMCRIAEQLKAKVQGDDGELYKDGQPED